MKHLKALSSPWTLLIALPLVVLIIIACLQDGDDSDSDSGTHQQQDNPIQTLKQDGCQIRFTKPPRQTPLAEAFVIAVDASADSKATLDVETSALKENFTAKVTSTPPEQQGQNFTQHLDITIEPNWHGSYTLPEILVSFHFPDKPPVVIPIPEATIVIPEPSQEEQEITLDDDPAATPLTPPPPPQHKKWLLVAGCLAGFIMVLAATIILVRWLKHMPAKAQPPPPPIPPHVTAMDRLQKLLKSDLIPTGHIKEFYDRISDIVRDYIEARFGLKAPKQTTEEFLQSIQTTYAMALTPQHHDLINNFMSHTDLVKYARQTPSSQAISMTIQAARTFIQETIPVTPDATTPEHHD